MTQVTAWQHLFASLDRDQSPTRRRGYQTVFYTKDGIDEKDVQLLEDKARYYSSSEDSPLKLQFYWLPDKRWVVSQTVALAERDEFGRKGRYLTHSLILPPEAWENFGGAPFGVLKAKPFLTTLDELFNAGDMKGGDIAPIVLTASKDWQRGAFGVTKRWPQEALPGLNGLACQAASVRASGDNIAVLGPLAGILEFLAICFVLAPPNQRHLLCFDTHAYDCNWGKVDGFWAQGFPSADDAKGSLIVDAKNRQLETSVQVEEPTAYARWTDFLIKTDRLKQLPAGQDWAGTLDGFLRGEIEDRSLLTGIDQGFMKDFVDLNEDTVRQRLKTMLPADLPPELVEPVLSHLGRTPYEQFRSLLAEPQLADLADIIYGICLERNSPPAQEETKMLLPFAQFHAGIRSLLYLWNDDLDNWRKELDNLTSQKYRDEVQQLLDRGLISVDQAISPQHIQDWFNAWAIRVEPGGAVAVATALNDCGGPRAVDQLAVLVPHLGTDDLVGLQKWTRKTMQDKTPRLQQALEAKIGQPVSPLDRLKGLFDGLGGTRQPEKPAQPQPAKSPAKKKKGSPAAGKGSKKSKRRKS